MIIPFAQIDVEEAVMPWRKVGSSTRDSLMVIGALLLVVGALALWAAFIRKRRRRRSHHSHASSREVAPASTPVPSGRRKWRRRRREHRPRNPTLAETGGLPPIRDGGPREGSVG